MAAQIVTIEALCLADLDDVVELLRLTSREAGIEPEALTDRYVAGRLRSADVAGGFWLGARVGARLVGYAVLERTGDLAAPVGVVGLSVLRDHRRQGIGERLMRALLARIRDGGEIAEAWLAVAQENLPARRLYEKLGFISDAALPAGITVPPTYVTMLWRPQC